MGTKHLAFDLGASSGRAMLGSVDDEIITLTEIHRFPNRMVNILGHYHWDILSLFEEIKTGLAKTAQAGHTDILSIGIDTWGVDFGLIARDGSLLASPYAYRDMVNDDVMKRTFQKLSREELYRLTGIQFMPFNSIFQLYRLVEEESPLLQVAGRLLFMPDLLNYLLTGVQVSEYTIASTSQLLDPYKRNWHEELFARLGLPLHIMAEIVPPGTTIGRLRREIAEETGLPPVQVIAPASHDTASAVAAVPAAGDRWAYLSSGTWSLLGIDSPQPIINDDALRYNFTNEGGIDGKIRFLKNTAGMWIVQQLREAWDKAGEPLSYTELVRLAEESGSAPQRIDPDDQAFAKPTDMSVAIIDYCRRTRQPEPTTKGQFIRCVLESLAAKYQQVVESLNSLLPQPIQRLHIVGGGSQNQLLNRLTEQATGVQVIAGPAEATAIGNIKVQHRACQLGD
ncbi:MAG: rhamnulokinase [Calditrichaeota bacterium]|nr:MAG: rhamnulokinase [Calditrichota bacterium]